MTFTGRTRIPDRWSGSINFKRVDNGKRDGFSEVIEKALCGFLGREVSDHINKSKIADDFAFFVGDDFYVTYKNSDEKIYLGNYRGLISDEFGYGFRFIKDDGGVLGINELNDFGNIEKIFIENKEPYLNFIFDKISIMI